MTSRPRLLNESRLIDGVDEIGGGAVHDRRLRPVDFDQDVVDLKAGDRGEKMLDRADAYAGFVAENGAERSAGHIGPFGLEKTFATARQTGAQKRHARVDVCGMKNDLSRRSRVYAHAIDPNPVA